jgi:hypothetical protein
MAGDEYEPNRVLGIPRTRHPNTRQDRELPPRQDREPQRVMGFPVNWFGPVLDGEWVESLAHPIRTYRRWLRRRRLGPYAIDKDEPSPRR